MTVLGTRRIAAFRHPGTPVAKTALPTFLKPPAETASSSASIHDVAVLVGNFTKDGTYYSPHTYPGLNVETFGEFAKGVWTAFPDLSVELLNVGEIEPGVGVTHWIVRGTNTGPGADGSDPTGRTVSFKGASIIQIEGDKLRSETAYFDPNLMQEQLGAK